MSSTSGITPLKFVSAAEIEEKRKKRQEEWERVRQPHQPLEAPEEVVETRSLYEQLQAQKDAKQLEYEEQHRMKNKIHGLDKEEVEFLDYVHDRQQDIEMERQLEEMSALEELRSSVAAESAVSADVSTEKPTSTTAAVTTKKRTSQAELLAGAVKRKRSDGESSADQSADSLQSHGCDEPPSSSASQELTASDDNVTSTAASTGVATVVGILPGLGNYTDSDQSDASTSDSDIDTDLFRRDVQSKPGHDPATTTSTAKHRHH